jgi:cell wall-associated NlpC family hydrolase
MAKAAFGWLFISAESKPMIDIEAERAAVVEEAREWLRTPYHHMGRVKGAGVDCATLLAEVFARAGAVPRFGIPFYPPDWHLHRDAERYLGFVLEHAREIESDPLPADMALWRFGRCFSHGAIVVDWPLVIHAYAGKGCLLEDVSRARWLSQIGERRGAQPRPVKFLRLNRWMS